MEKEIIQQFVNHYSLEVTPASADNLLEQGVADHNRTVYITYLPNSDFIQTLETAKKLSQKGYSPVPHLAVRSIKDKGTLDQYLNQAVNEYGISQILLIAGSLNEAIGEFSSTMDALETGLFDRYAIDKIGFAGHPEGSPDISDEKLRQAERYKYDLQNKTDSALYFVTQFCFDIKSIIAWDQMLLQANCALPVHIGIPGPTKLVSLIKHAKNCGVGSSIQFLLKQGKTASKLLLTNHPDQLITDLSLYQSQNPNTTIEKIHVFPFGGIQKTVNWFDEIELGNILLNSDQNGFTVVESP